MQQPGPGLPKVGQIHFLEEKKREGAKIFFDKLNKSIFCSKKFLVLRIEVEFGSLIKCHDPMSHYEPRYVLYRAGMLRYENETYA